MLKLVVFDFDGVFTNGKCYFDNSNNAIKYYNVKDGMALSILKNNNIKTGLISSFNTTKNILLNENNINVEIINHLKFDLKYIGNKKKIEILDEWIINLNLNYNEIAYIGDDINDLDIIKKVKFSGCPLDAVDECKNEVNYICKKSGGDGCVREFADKIIELNKKNDDEYEIINKIKNEAIYQLNNFNFGEIYEVIRMIKSSNTIYFTGIGKSENIAVHCANLLKSIGIKAFYLNAINSLHGDIGTLQENDLVLLFSKSGNTAELLDMIPFLHQKKCFTIGIHCDGNCKFETKCKKTIKLPFKNEIDGNIKNIPTNSYMSQMFFCNIIVSILKENISKEKYKENHPSGHIGNCMKTIKECLIYDYPKFKINKNIPLHNVLLEMTKYKIGCSFFVNDNNELIGIITDGDIRRKLVENNENIGIYINYENINTNFYYENDLNKYINECKKYNYIPFLDGKKIIGIISHIYI